MTSLKILKSAIGASRIISSRLASTSTSGKLERTAGINLDDFNPKSYNVPIRVTTMDDMMEPYGPWKQAYEAEIRAGNKMIFIGFMSLSASLLFLFNCGALEGLDMPNLDNIMQETEPFNFDTEGRVSVTRDDE